MKGQIAIIGVGNKLMGDEGVGAHAVEYLRGLPPLSSPLTKGGMNNAIDLLDGGTGGMALFHMLEGYDRAIIIDAADFGAAPGGVKAFELSDINLAPDPAQVSLHGTSLAGILALAEKLGQKMPKITILAVQPHTISPSMELSPVCRAALPEIANKIISVL